MSVSNYVVILGYVQPKCRRTLAYVQKQGACNLNDAAAAANEASLLTTMENG